MSENLTGIENPDQRIGEIVSIYNKRIEDLRTVDNKLHSDFLTSCVNLAVNRWEFPALQKSFETNRHHYLKDVPFLKDKSLILWVELSSFQSDEYQKMKQSSSGEEVPTLESAFANCDYKDQLPTDDLTVFEEYVKLVSERK